MYIYIYIYKIYILLFLTFSASYNSYHWNKLYNYFSNILSAKTMFVYLIVLLFLCDGEVFH